jgi:hypothetical protein
VGRERTGCPQHAVPSKGGRRGLQLGTGSEGRLGCFGSGASRATRAGDDLRHRVIPDSCGGAAVNRKRDVLVGMAEALGDNGHRDSVAEQDAGVRMSQRVKTHALKPHFPHQFHYSGAQAVGRIVVPVGLAENQIAVDVSCAEQGPVSVLFRPVLPSRPRSPTRVRPTGGAPLTSYFSPGDRRL